MLALVHSAFGAELEFLSDHFKSLHSAGVIQSQLLLDRMTECDMCHANRVSRLQTCAAGPHVSHRTFAAKKNWVETCILCPRIELFLLSADAFDNDLVLQTLQDILQGKTVQIPVYDFVTHSR